MQTLDSVRRRRPDRRPPRRRPQLPRRPPRPQGRRRHRRRAPRPPPRRGGGRARRSRASPRLDSAPRPSGADAGGRGRRARSSPPCRSTAGARSPTRSAPPPTSSSCSSSPRRAASRRVAPARAARRACACRASASPERCLARPRAAPAGYSGRGHADDQQPADRAQRPSSPSSRPRSRDAADGRPSLAFVAGESGVGKSRLVAELARRAREDGARVAIGECVELGDEELPYAPIVSVLRSLARDDDPVLDELPPAARAELAALLPELGGEARAEPGPRRRRASRGCSRRCSTLLDLLGREQPFALVLEDIHWADRSTRAFLVFLARSLWTERVLVIATYRSDELHRRHPLRPLLAELERDTRSRADRARAADARRARRPARRHPRRRARRRARRAPVRAQRGQPAVHRGAAGGAARRPRRAADARCATR